MDPLKSLAKMELSRYLTLLEGGEERCARKGVGGTPGTAERSGCHWARRLLAAEEGVVVLALFFMVPGGRTLGVAGFVENVRACFRTVPG